jgi:hypothetical protein
MKQMNILEGTSSHSWTEVGKRACVTRKGSQDALQAPVCVSRTCHAAALMINDVSEREKNQDNTTYFKTDRDEPLKGEDIFGGWRDAKSGWFGGHAA